MSEQARPASQGAAEDRHHRDRVDEIAALTEVVMAIRMPRSVGDEPTLPSCALVEIEHDIPAGSTALTVRHPLGRAPVGAFYVGQMRVGGPLRPVEFHANLSTSNAAHLAVTCYSAAGHGASRTRSRFLVF